MIVLVPVSRFRVPYDTARGRPYSPLEALALEAVADGGATLAELRDAFRVHERLIVEAVVTLVTAGWVAVAGGPQARFVLTAAGARAAGTGADPVSVVVSAARPQTVVMERVTGQVARHIDAKSWHKGDLGDDAWKQAAIMRELIVRNSLDEAQVQKLLPHETGHWIRRIGPIRLASRATHFVAVDADLDSGLVRGLPHAWTEALASKVLDCARARRARDADADAGPGRSGQGRPAGARRPRFAGVAEPRRPAARTTPFDLAESNVLRGTGDHETALLAAFETARTSVAVAAPTVRDLDSFRSVVEAAVAAVARGVAVDLLVGDAPGLAVSELVAAANAAGYRADPKSGRARLRVRNPTTGSGASLLVYDSAAGLTAVIGDHDWFGPSDGALSVRLTELSLAADAARAVGSLWRGREWVSPAWAAPAERWGRLASEAEESGAIAQVARRDAAATGAAAHGELLVDDEHAGVVPGEDIVIGGHQADPTAGEAGMRGASLRVTGEGVGLLLRGR